MFASFFTKLFDTSDYPARWTCGNWSKPEGWLHILSDLGVWSAYLAIPLVLGFFLRQRKDLPFRRIFVLFGAFILLCGTTHLMDAVVFWWPAYRLSGIFKLFTALISWATVISLFTVLPQALRMRSPEELEREVAGRKAAEAELLRANAELEERVALRTAELTKAVIDSNRLAAIVTSSADAMISKDLHGIVTSWNKGAERIFGYTAEEMIGAAITKLIPEDRKDEETRILAKIRQGEKAEHSETIRQTKCGKLIHVSVTASPIKDATGKVIGASKVARDITAQKQSQEELYRNEKRLRGILNASPAGIVQTDAAGCLTLVNHRWCEMLGYTEPELLGRSVIQVTHPSSVDATVTAVASLAAGGPDFQIEKHYLRKDDSVISGQTNVTALRSPAGEFLGFIAVVVDISERLRIEAELREKAHFLQQIAQVTPGVLQVFDLTERRAVFINRSVATLLGYTPDEATARGSEVVPSLMHPDDLPRFEQHLTRVRDLADGVVADFEHRMRDRAGMWHWFHSHDSIFARDAEGVATQLIGVATEITGRKRAEESLARLAAIVESSHDALFSEDLDGIITSWNPGAEHIFGYGVDEIVGTSILQLIPGDCQAEEIELQRKITIGERGGTFETLRLAKDGRQFPASVTIAPMKDSGGEVIGTSRVVRDITERKRVEQALRENAHLFSTLIDQAPMGTYVVDTQLRIMQVNAEAMPAFAPVHPLVGRDLLEVLQIMWGAQLAAHIVEIFQHTLVSGERHVSAPSHWRRHDLGVEQIYEWQTQRVVLPDGGFGVACYFHEVTERVRSTEALRASQERMRLGAEATGVGIWEWNVLSNTIRWDTQMFRLYGVEPTEDGSIPYETWSSAVHPDDLRALETILQDTVQGHGHSTREFRIVRTNDQEIRIIEAIETVGTNLDGKTEWVVGSNLDVTERRQTAQKLREAKEAAESANRSKDRFLAILSHELRTPLTPVLMTVSALEHDPELRPSVREDMTMVRRNIEMETKLIDDLLDVSRIASGKLELRMETLDLNAALLHVCSICRPQVLGQEVQLNLDLCQDAGSIEADPARFEQVLWNVLKNAVKFTPRKGRIHITTKRLSPSRVEVRITDNGAGIPPEVLPRIFDAFEQGDPRITRQFGGLGLGLAISKALIELHGGSIRAESPGAGHGATFIIEVPGAQMSISSPADPIAAALSGPSALRLLVVEDHADTSRALKILLSQEGFTVTLASDVASALALARKETFDLLVSDLGLPDASGYELMARIQSIQPLRGIAMSGYGMEEDVRQSLAAGFSEHLVKPIKIPQLLAAIQRTRAIAAESDRK